MSEGLGQPPGWYYAQGDPPGTTRYWDGGQWIGDPVSAAGDVGSADPLGRLTEGWGRIGGRVIDGLVWAVLSFVLNLPGFISNFQEGIDAANEGREANITVNVPLTIISGILATVAVVAYEVFMNTGRGTLGKRVTNSRVVELDGSPLTRATAFRRMWLYIGFQVLGLIAAVTIDPNNAGLSFLAGLPFWIVALAGLVMLFSDSRKQTPWDKIGRTLVVTN